MATLTLDSVSKVYKAARGKPVLAVDAVDMAIADGEIIGLLGSSGCGKTSTLRMIAGFEDVTSGHIEVGGRVIDTLLPAERNIAMAFEGYALYPPLRVRDNIGFALLRDRQPRAEVKRQVEEIAELLEIVPALDRYPPTISAGQQQRTSLARALIRKADVFLLDEPMSQLEPQLRAVLRARLKDWLITRRMTTVFVTHDQTEAIALADRIAVMEEGVLQQFASPDELKERPANLFVASFIGEPPMNLFEARVDRSRSGLGLAVLDAGGARAFELRFDAEVAGLADGAAVHLGMRPHRLRLGDRAGAVQGTVTSHSWLGDQTHVGVEIGGTECIVVAEGEVPARLGAPIAVEVPLRAVHLFDADDGRALFHGSEAAS
ncbi:MAG: ABC transporter ATP-binding protein [Geminicoccaceae bacterium]